MKEKNKGGAPLGNQNNLVWTKEKALEYIKEVFEFVKDNEQCRSMSKACTETGHYETVLNYLQEKFDISDVDFKPIKACKDIIKARLMEQALNNDANATMAIFILKNNHGMADKVETKQEVTVTETVTVFELPNNKRD